MFLMLILTVGPKIFGLLCLACIISLVNDYIITDYTVGLAHLVQGFHSKILMKSNKP